MNEKSMIQVDYEMLEKLRKKKMDGKYKSYNALFEYLLDKVESYEQSDLYHQMEVEKEVLEYGKKKIDLILEMLKNDLQYSIKRMNGDFKYEIEEITKVIEDVSNKF